MSNILSISRIILIIPAFYLIAINNPVGNIALMILGVIIIATDYFDGFFSRKFNQVTELGKFLDPIADKISMAVILVALVVYRDFPIALVIFLLYRDILILVFGSIITKKNEVPSANWWGKTNTFVVAFTGLFFIFELRNPLITIFFFCSFLTIIISGASYYLMGEKTLFEKRWQKYLSRTFAVAVSAIIISLLLSFNYKPVSNPYPVEDQFPEKEQLIRKYSPVLYFGQEESFFPADVETFLENSKFMKRSMFWAFDSEVEPGGGSAGILQKMAKYTSDDYYIKIDRGLFDSIEDKYKPVKETAQKTVYATAFKINKDGKPIYILQYWFFYWASEAGDTGITWHEGDWEVAMYWLDENFKPLKAGYSQHYNGEVRPWVEIETEEGRPVVYAALGSHSSNFKEGEFKAYFDNSRRVPLGSDKCRKDVRLGPGQYHLTMIDSTLPWVRFEGYWGITITTKLFGPKYRNPMNNTLSMWGNPVGWFKKYEKK